MGATTSGEDITKPPNSLSVVTLPLTTFVSPSSKFLLTFRYALFPRCPRGYAVSVVRKVGRSRRKAAEIVGWRAKGNENKRGCGTERSNSIGPTVSAPK